MFEFAALVSSLEKIFPETVCSGVPYDKITALCGEEVSFQAVFRTSHQMPSPCEVSVSVESPISQYISLYNVVSIPSELPAYPDRHDGGYIKTTPGLYPDLLKPLENGRVCAVCNNTNSVWISVRLPENTGAGEYPVSVRLYEKMTRTSKILSFNISVIGSELPKRHFPTAMWFHNDCIASVHDVPVQSEKHWELIEKYMTVANDIGVNTILTPIFTPPLDTEVGSERPTFQLVDVKKTSCGYEFGFEKLDRYVSLSKKCGMEYFEISHLFTQWGATHAPKIMADVDGEEKRIFGWETDVREREYPEFLDAFLPELTKHLTKLGIADKCFFHVSDEPDKTMLEDYKYAKSLVDKHLKGFRIMDALSNFEFYETGAVDLPVVAVDHIKPFLDGNVSDIFCYYCCCQTMNGVANRFFAMPSARSRILAYQMYKYDTKGFLQWGYNFYYAQFSKGLINPYEITDSRNAFPSGDAFMVYPSEDGTPYYSIRAKVFKQMTEDWKAMKKLEELSDKKTVMDIVERNGQLEGFSDSLRSAQYILETRELINRKIAQLI